MNEDEEAAQDKDEEFEDWEEVDDWFSVHTDAKFESVKRGAMKAIYSHLKAIKLICATVSGIASEDMEDKCKHVIGKGEEFITVLYLHYRGEKWNLGMVYKDLGKTVYIWPIQLFFIAVPAHRQENQRYVLSLTNNFYVIQSRCALFNWQWTSELWS